MAGTRRSLLAYWLLGYSLFILIAGSSLPSPIYELYRSTWGLSATTITLIFAVYALALIPTLLLFGQLSDHIGRRKVIAPGLAISAAGTLCFAFATSVAWLFVARALQGIAVGTVIGALTAALAEAHPRQERQAAALIASASTASGAAFGPLLGAMLAQYRPWPLRLPYLVQFALLIPSFVGIWLLEETVEAQPERTRWRPVRPSIPASIRLPFWLSSSVIFICWSVSGLFLALGPTYIVLLLRFQDLTITGGTLFPFSGACALTQLLCRHLSPHTSTIAGILLLIVGLAGMVLAVPAHELLLLLVSAIVCGSGQGRAWMGSLALVNLVAPSERRSNVLASYYVAAYTGLGIPVIAVGYLADAIDLYSAFVMFAVVISIAALVLAAYIASHRDRLREFLPPSYRVPDMRHKPPRKCAAGAFA